MHFGLTGTEVDNALFEENNIMSDALSPEASKTWDLHATELGPTT